MLGAQTDLAVKIYFYFLFLSFDYEKDIYTNVFFDIYRAMGYFALQSN